MPAIRFNGFSYPVVEKYTNREMIRLEMLSGLDTSEISEKITSGRLPWALMLAVATVALERAGATVTHAELLDADADALDWVADPEAVDADAAEVEGGAPGDPLELRVVGEGSPPPATLEERLEGVLGDHAPAGSSIRSMPFAESGNRG